MKQILVIGGQDDFPPSLGRGDGITTHQIVGLRVWERDVLEAEQRRELLNEIELRNHRLRHLFARFFVSGLQLYAKLGHSFVPDDCAIFRLQVFHHPADGFGESEDRVCRFAPRIGQVLNGKEGAINVIVSVD